MRADVFQAVALCCHSNAYLAGEDDRPPDLLPSSPFAMAHEIVFERSATGKLAAGVVADAIGPWLRRLAKEGVEKLELNLAGCPFDPRSSTPEPWGVLTDGDLGVEIWQPVWKKRIRTHSDPAPWRVCYLASRASRWNAQSPYTPLDVAKLLAGLIKQTSPAHRLISDLALAQSLPFPDLYPTGWPDEQRLLGELGAKTAGLLRSEEWAQVILRREMNPEEHDAISQKLWKASLMALEYSARPDERALERPTAQNIRLAG